MKIAAVTTLLPQTHYAQYLCRALDALAPGALTVYADQDPRNAGLTGCGRVKPAWPHTPAYVSALLRELESDPPDVVHLQHEFNMYGGALTAALFPYLLWRLRRMGLRLVVTVHAVVDPRVIDRRFLSMFGRGMRFCPPFVMRLFFGWLYRCIARLADRVVIHTQTMRDILVERYQVPAGPLVVIPHGVPAIQESGCKKERYALYFGYIARRKGLQNVLSGFQRFLTEHPESDLTLVLAGGTIDGQAYAREEIEQWVADRQLNDRIRLTGFVEGGTPLDELFGKASCVLIPAEVSIAASGPLAQAMHYGKFVLASRVGNLVEEVEHGVDGYLVENDRWQEAFAFVDDPHHAEDINRMESRVREKAQARAWPRIAQRHLDLYRSILT
jgi:glycosyltransferase involved in cell wall biosynthesis